MKPRDTESIKIDLTQNIPKAPDLEGLIDGDILERFQDSAVFYGDIINAQLIKTNKELIKTIQLQGFGD